MIKLFNKLLRLLFKLKHFTSIFLLLIVNNSFSQNKKLNIGISINPILHYNYYNVTNSNLGNMKHFNIGIETAIELDYSISNRISLAPIIKYYQGSQKIEQNNFFGYLNNDSKVWIKYTYNFLDLGISLKYNLCKENILLAGVTYSMANLNKVAGGHHLNGSNENTSHLGSIEYKFSPDDVGVKNKTPKALIGLRKRYITKKNKLFEYGFTLYIPVNKMPNYSYNQVLITNNNGSIKSNSSYESRQYSMNLLLIYYLRN